jgi:myo-inositol-1(or 4)-monophosphatase
MDLSTVTRVAVKAAYGGAGILRARIGRLSTIAKKGPIDLVTDADLSSESEIMRIIGQAYPHHTIVAEEGGGRAGAPEHRWIVDPLDGTVNYAHQVPFFAVSIAYVHRDAAQVGVVLNPLSGELFSAEAGGGAQLNGEPIRVSTEAILSECLLATGFPYDLDVGFETLGARFLRCLKQARGVRRLGSAALDLCYVACGRFAGYWEDRLQPWDSAAGTLIVQEAGGTVTDFLNRPVSAEARQVVATNGRIHPQLLSLMEVEHH